MTDKTKEIFRCVREIGKSFSQPDDDWIPILILDRPNGKREVFSVAFGSQADKEKFAFLLPMMFRDIRPTFAAMVISAWSVRIEKDNPNAEREARAAMDTGISKHKDRYEVVIVTVATKDGGQEEYHAEIGRRDGRPPTLGAFTKIESDRQEGRFANLLSRGFEAMK